MNQYLRILIVDDEADCRETYKMLLESKEYAAAAAGSAEEALQLLQQEFYNIILSDIIMPGMNGLAFLQEVKKRYADRIEVIMTTGYGSIETAVEAMKLGAFSYFVKSYNPDELLMEIEKAAARLEMANMKSIQYENSEKFLLKSKNPAMQKVWEMVDLVAGTSANVLITGESGTGKEIVAEEIHRRSARREKPFIAINCQQYPHELIESELFGHEKGAFTGAVSRRIGKLEQAAGGTVFLDEIGELSLDVQVMLLRVLETRCFERIGGVDTIEVDTRVVTATNRDLAAMVAEGTFREDLYYRLDVVTIHLPPLRERTEDIPPLVNHYLAYFAKENGRPEMTISESAMSALCSYPWPGNIRELKNCVERRVVLTRSNTIDLDNVPINIREKLTPGISKTILSSSSCDLERNEKMLISRALEECGGNRTKAAEKLGISRRTLHRKLTLYGIE